MKSKLSAALIALSIIGAYAALAGSTAARAALITFTLSDVVFTGVGCSPQTPCGTATGSFTFSSDTGLVTDVNILTDRGGNCCNNGRAYTHADTAHVIVSTGSGINGNFTDFRFIFDPSAGFPFLELVVPGTSPSFTLPSQLLPCQDSPCLQTSAQSREFSVSSNGDRFIFQGSLVPTPAAVPGPIVGAGLPGLVLALGGLIAWMRRRRQAVK